ncbi:hypothetical protein KKG71_03065, partial [Patescibacteria group bacterium]|nr:hypothetical protein [Patescibacteria group bacterium]
MAIKSQKLFYDMKRSENKLTESITQNLISKIRNMGASKKGEEKSLIKKIISDISEKLSTIFTSPPEETAQKQIISAINSQIWDYYKLWFKSAKEGKKEILATIADLKKEKRKEVENLKKIKKHLSVVLFAKAEKKAEHLWISFLLSANTFTGWLLTFYLIYYVIGFLLISKNFGFNQNISWNFNVFQIPLLKQFIITTFIVHSATSLKIIFFRHNFISSLVISIISTIFILLAIINL